MSGGRWNYQQDEMRDLGERLGEEKEPVLVAAGAHLIELAECLREADRFLSNDGSAWDKDRLARLLPDSAVYSTAFKMMSEASAKFADAAAMMKERTK